jgi:hypothetical protein
MNTDRFDDGGGFAGVSDAMSDFLGNFCPYTDTMPDAEDMLADDEIRFVGYFVMIKQALAFLSRQVTDESLQWSPIPKTVINTEGMLEQWIAEAECILPEWSHDALIEPTTGDNHTV